MERAARPFTALTAAVALAAVAIVGGTASSTALFTSRSVNGGGAVSAAPDWTPPAVSLAHPGAVVRGVVIINATASDGETGVGSVVIAGAPAGTSSFATVCTIPTAPWTCSINTATSPDGVYDLRATATDNAGYSASSTVTGVRIDNTAPTGTLTVPAAPLSGSVLATATLVETGSGLGLVEIQWAPTGTTTWSTAACTKVPTGGTCTLNTIGVANAVYDLRVRATDVAGNVGYTPTVTRQVSNVPSGVALQEPGSYLRGTTTFTATATSSLGITSVTVQRSASASGPWTNICVDTATPYTCSVNTSGFPDGATYFRAVLLDGGGVTTTSAVLGPRTVDNSLVRGVDIQAVGTGNNYFGNGDVYLYTYSQVIQPSSLLPGWDGTSRPVVVRMTDSGAGIRSTDFFEVLDQAGTTRFELGQVEMKLSVMTYSPQQMFFAGNIAMETTTFEGRQVTRVRLTVGAWQGWGTAWPTGSAAHMTWHPSAAARDLTNIGTSTGATVETGTLDNDL